MKEKKQKYERRKEVKDKTRNNNFVAALDYLKRQSKEKLYQKDLAEMLGVTENTISNIINYHTEVSEDMITQIQTVSGCVFNLQWLRGQSDVMLAADVTLATTVSKPAADPMLDAILKAKDETIAALRSQLAEMERTITTKDDVIASKEAHINTLQQQVMGHEWNNYEKKDIS